MLKAKIDSLRRGIRSIISWGKRIVYEEILVLGDSHALVFNQRKLTSCFPDHFFHLVIVEGATVSGLPNPNSKTQALPIFMSRLKKSTASTTIVLLGEIDTGFVIWYRSEKYNTPVEVMLQRAIENYQGLLATIATQSNVICISTPLPTIRDGQNWGEVANARKHIKATQRQRTELTIQFNKKMREFCEKNRLLYLSFDDESLGENGLVSKYLLNSNPNDHHYNREKYAEMIRDKLKVFQGLGCKGISGFNGKECT